MSGIGTEKELRVVFRDRDTGLLTDPTTVTGKIWTEDGVTEDLNYARESLGVWKAFYTLKKDGTHWWSVLGTGTIKVYREKKFTVPKQVVA